MKINQEMKRKIVQVAAFVYSNTYIGNFVCPAARLACPIGAMQAVSGSFHFQRKNYGNGLLM